MTQILKGKEVVDALNEKLIERTNALKEKGINPTLAIVRLGAEDGDVSYEKGATKRAETIGVAVKNYILDREISQEELLKVIDEINKDDSIHGVLIFRPFPKHIDDATVRAALDPRKDVDGITDGSMAGVYTSTDLGFPPCTPEACMEILDHYGVDLTGKRAVVIGRSLVVGKPVAMMLMKKNATITVCHTRTVDMPSVAKEADVLVVAAGKAKAIGAEYFTEKQIIVDVGINWDEEAGKLCGDVDFEAADGVVSAITPVPGGVGTVTTSMLIKHTIEVAESIA